MPEHSGSASCLMIFKAEIIFQGSPVGFNNAPVLYMITFKAAHKSVHVPPWRRLKPYAIVFESSTLI